MSEEEAEEEERKKFRRRGLSLIILKLSIRRYFIPSGDISIGDRKKARIMRKLDLRAFQRVGMRVLQGLVEYVEKKLARNVCSILNWVFLHHHL